MDRERRLPPGTILTTADAFYSVIEPLGPPGGNATAFLVQCTGGPYRGVPFAAKLFVSDKPERRDGFRREIQYLLRHDHPAILRVYDEGTLYGELPFYVSRYMATNLAQTIKTDLTMLDRLFYATQLSSALVFLAASDPAIIHRDIKPKNVFVNGRTCLLGDFGMLQRWGESSSRESGPPGPVGYRSPELVLYAKGGDPPPPSSDTFQMGLVLCELFTGRNPLRMSKFEDDLELEPMTALSGPLGLPLTRFLGRMIDLEAQARPSPDETLGTFNQFLTAEAQGLGRSVGSPQGSPS